MQSSSPTLYTYLFSAAGKCTFTFTQPFCSSLVRWQEISLFLGGLLTDFSVTIIASAAPVPSEDLEFRENIVSSRLTVMLQYVNSLLLQVREVQNQVVREPSPVPDPGCGLRFFCDWSDTAKNPRPQDISLGLFQPSMTPLSFSFFGQIYALTNYHVHYTTGINHLFHFPGFLQLCERLFPSLSYPSLFHTPRSLIPQAGHYILGRIYLLGSSVPTTSWLPCGSQVSIKVWTDVYVGYINWPISCTLSRNYTYKHMYLCSIVFDILRLQWMVLYLLRFHCNNTCRIQINHFAI